MDKASTFFVLGIFAFNGPRLASTYVCNTPDDWLMPTGNDSSKNFYPGTKWPGAVVKYELHSSLSAADRTEVQKAFDEYHRKTCIRFVSRSAGEAAYTSIETDNSVCGLGHLCRVGGYQFAKFGSGCRDAETMIHELGHNLCMGHEQSRSDRDNHLSFPGCSANDIPGKDTNSDLRNSMYDYASQMHYQCNWCPGGWPKNTNVKKCGSDVTSGLSVLDAEKLNDFYDCGGCFSYRYRNFQHLTSGDRAAILPAGTDPFVGTTYACRGQHPNGDIMPGAFNLNTLTCYVAYGGGEQALRSGDVLTNPRGVRMSWILRPGNSIPSNAIPGGRTRDGETLYVARATITANGRTATVPGKVHANAPGFAYVSYGGVEYKVTTFDILVCNP